MWVVTLTYDVDGVWGAEEALALEKRLEPIDGWVFVYPAEKTIGVIVYVDDASGAVEAGATASEQVRGIIGDPHPLVGLEALEEWLADVRAPGDLDNLISTAEVAGLLGVQRQRVHQLRSHELFPKPAAEKEFGTFWYKDEIEEFLRKWDRKPGRPRKQPKAS